MNNGIDPNVSGPLICMLVAVIGFIWLKVTERAYNRKHGRDPSSAEASPHREKERG